MDGKRDIYGMDKRLEQLMALVRNSPVLTTQEKVSLDSFKRYCFNNGCKIARTIRHVQNVLTIKRLLVERQNAEGSTEADYHLAITSLSEFTPKDVEDLVSIIRETNKWSSETKLFLFVSVKKYFGDFQGLKLSPLKISRKRDERQLPKDIPTLDDVLKLVDACDNVRDKAFISLLYDSGCRISEIGNLTLRDIVFDDNGAYLTVTGKTGARRVRLIRSVKPLKDWLQSHPDKSNREATVFLQVEYNKQGEGERDRKEAKRYAPLQYFGMLKIVERAKTRAGIQKRLNPHSFRHARATELAARGLNETQMCSFFGWLYGSEMPRVYVHLSGADVDNALFKAMGMKKQEALEIMVNCPRCGVENTEATDQCAKCYAPLQMRAAVSFEAPKPDLKLEEMIQAVLERKLSELKEKA